MMQAIADQPPKSKTPLWREEDPVLGENGSVIKGGMFRHQRKWWNLPNFIRLLVTGYGGGKTLLLCKRMVSLCIQNCPAPVAIVCPTYPMAAETVVSTLEEILAGKQIMINRSEGGKGFQWSLKKDKPFKFFIGYHGRVNRIIVYSGEDPRRLKGPNLGAAGIDEPFIQEEEVFTQMIARVRHPKARKLEVNLTGTPEQLGWGYELAEGEMGKGHDVGVVQASTRENLALLPEYADRLSAALDEKAQLAYIEGQFVNLSSGMVYYAFNAQDNVVDLPMPPEADLGVGMDFNVNPMAAAVFWHTKDHIHFIEEIELPNSDTQEMCGYLRERYWEEGLRQAYPDSSGAQRRSSAPAGKTDYSYIEAAGFNVNKHPGGNPLRRDRYNAANGLLRPYKDRVRCTLSPKCMKLKKYLRLYSHELMNKESQKAMSHLLDAATYPIAYLFPVVKESLKLRKLSGI